MQKLNKFLAFSKSNNLLILSENQKTNNLNDKNQFGFIFADKLARVIVDFIISKYFCIYQGHIENEADMNNLASCKDSW